MKDGIAHTCQRPSLRDTGWKAAPQSGLDVSTDASVLQGEFHCSVGLHKSRPARPKSSTSLLPTHSSPRPDRRRGEGKDWEKKQEQQEFRASSGVAVFFSAVASFQAHIIQSNLSCVTTPFFAFEDDALDVSPSQGDLGLPPAMATVSSP